MNDNLLGKRITLARKAAGFTQRDLAKIMGVKQQCIGHWERGHCIPRLKYAWWLACALNINLDKLCHGLWRKK